MAEVIPTAVMTEVYSGIPVLSPEEPAEEPESTNVSLFDDGPTEDDIVLPPVEIIPPVDEGLTDDDRKIFIDLIKKFSTPEARARQLAKLAMFSDTKRAAVALRAIQEINALTGVSTDKPTEAPPMFALPKDSRVSISVTKVVK